MQSACGKLRQAAKQTLNHPRFIELRNFASFESKYSSVRSGPRTAFSLDKSFGPKTFIPPSFKRYGLASMLPSSGGQILSLDRSAAIASAWPTRNITTSTSTSIDASASASASDSPSPDVTKRIKFKRLDKTARHIMQIIDKEAVEEVKTNREIPDIRPGYIVQLKVEVPENKRRVSVIKGIVIARRNAGLNTTFRIRRLVAGVGIESLFPLYSPNIKEIKVLEKKKVRRAKLYYLREKMNALKKQ
ncbi:Ribosomal protein L19 family protein [Striga hermonthica]|uniref:Ribosomal protein L19 family protein n=1 Tax=Striga hermonthica TaxID=68872 RepID=A0A9N7N2R5_STRHE|nr:Ribosomal protein L19 family protein [Striga hermonthica]